jgi:hypothetical protein
MARFAASIALDHVPAVQVIAPLANRRLAPSALRSLGMATLLDYGGGEIPKPGRGRIPVGARATVLEREPPPRAR